jgi:pimeloyl-ACP methyl ester carboxylesterase
MKEYPVFIPFRDMNLAAVVAVPEGELRGVVILLSGMGASRSHRYRLWVRTARALAEKGIASVRADWPKLGDSTGDVELNLERPLVDLGTAIARFAIDAFGTDKIVFAGNCIGGVTSLATAARVEESVGAVVLLPGTPKTVLAGEGRTAPHRIARRTGKKAPKLARFARRFVNTAKVEPRLRFAPSVDDAVVHNEVLFLFIGSDEAAARLRKATDEHVARMGQRVSGAIEVQTVVAEGSDSFQLGLSTHPQVVAAIVRWMDGVFPPRTAAA